MDTELASLSATLRGIEGLHASIAHASAKPQPFTNALLNTHDLPVLSYIRDADPLEAGLFFYPRSAQAQQQQQQQGQAGAGNGTQQNASGSQQQQQQQQPVHEMTAEEQYALLNPRGPEIKPHQPPTPLRRPVPTGGKAGQDDYDASILLIAAQKLLDNYHKAPRARKHIKTLQKRNADAARLILESEASVAESEAAILQRGASPPASEADATPTQQQQQAPAAVAAEADAQEDPRVKRRQEYEALQAELQRDDLDCFALEQLIRELHGERDVLMSPRKVASRASSSAFPPVKGAGGRRLGGPRASSLARTGAGGEGLPTSALGTTSRRSAVARTAASSAASALQGSMGTTAARNPPSTPGRASALSRSVAEAPSTPAGLNLQPESVPAGGPIQTAEEEADETVLPAQAIEPIAAAEHVEAASVTAEASSTAATAEHDPSQDPAAASENASAFFIPEPTPELERISTNIRSSFGDALRFVGLLNPALSNLSGFVSTYEALHALAYPTQEGGYGSEAVLAPYVADAAAASAGDGGADDDAATEAGSVVTSNTATTAGTSLAGSSGAASSHIDPPTPTATAVAFVLLQLLGSPPSSDPGAPSSHAVEFAALKARADEWWETTRPEYARARESIVGRAGAGASGRAEAKRAAEVVRAAGLAEAEEKSRGESLATKAVYALVAKRLLRIRRAGGSAAVGFA
ncbi:hypothetical protein OC834_005553 [Tilletia horrida]|nr:hypothetical protein OC834_005553 [Tilletia horrida]